MMSDPLRFDDRVVIVTGAARGLGREHALHFARRGASVVINDIPEAETAVSEIVAEIKEIGGCGAPCLGSVADPETGERIAQVALSSFGRIDAVVNNAGVLRDRTLARMSDDEFRTVVDVHLLGAFYVTRPAIRVMREQGYGRVVFTSSASGLFGNFGQANYGAAKAGVVGLSNVLSLEGAKYGITSNVVSPVAMTDMTRGSFEQYGAVFRAEYVSPMVVFLASAACAVTGEVFSAGAQQVSRIFIGLTEGIHRSGEPFSPEEIAENLDEIRSLSAFSVPTSLEDEMDKFLQLMEKV